MSLVDCDVTPSLTFEMFGLEYRITFDKEKFDLTFQHKDHQSFKLTKKEIEDDIEHYSQMEEPQRKARMILCLEFLQQEAEKELTAW